MTIILYDYRFFSEIVLRRNYLINRVELFEEKSILVFPECLEASEWWANRDAASWAGWNAASALSLLELAQSPSIEVDAVEPTLLPQIARPRLLNL